MQRLVAIPRAELVNALRRVAPALAKGTTLPIFSAIHLMFVKGGPFIVSATDGDLTISATVAVEPESEGVVIVPGNVLSRFVEGLEGVVVLALDGNDLVITGSSSKLRLRTMSSEDWPTMPVAGGDMINLDADVLGAMARVSYAAAKDGKRPILAGVAVQTDGHVVATDTLRLAVHKIPEGIVDAILPARVVNLVAKSTKTCTLVVDERRATFRGNNTTWTTRLIEGQYPNWRGAVPAGDWTPITINRDALRSALERMDIFGGEYHAIALSGEGDTIRISNGQHDVGEGEEIVDATTSFEDSIGLNPRYLRDAIENVEGEDVEIYVMSSLKPVKIQSGDLLQLVMSVRV